MAAKRRTALAAARKAAGYTQEQLAAVLYVERSTVIRWEAGRHAPVPFLWPKLAHILGISRDQLTACWQTTISSARRPTQRPKAGR
jgi:DNA-binding XRE family transcriptional regulator